MNNIKVVLCEVGKEASITEIGASLKAMQSVVGGFIEPFHFTQDDNVVLICNEEGKINGSEPNRVIRTEPVEVDMTYEELKRRFREVESTRSGEHIEGYIVFTEDSFTAPYSLEERTYAVSSNNKAFQPNMGGYSIYGGSIDGSDPCVRLERYMRAEHGGENGWKIERCYMKAAATEDIIYGSFFICGEGEDYFVSLTEEQAERYKSKFFHPEAFFRNEHGEIFSVPIMEVNPK